MYPYHQKQIQQTRFFIYKAFFEMLETKNLQEIKISSLCQKAEISRRTFYRHFTSVQDIGKSWLKTKALEYENSLDSLQVDHYDMFQIAEEFFGFWQPYKKELCTLQNGKFPLYESFLQEGQKIIEKRAPSNFKRMAFYSLGGFYSLLMDWMEDETKSAEEYLWKIENELESIKPF